MKIIVLICVSFIIQAIAVPLNNLDLYLKKRDVDGTLPLSTLISNVEDSLSEVAYSANLMPNLNKLRNQRGIISENPETNPKTQLSVVRVKLNPVNLNKSKDSTIKTEFADIKNGTKYDSSDEKQEKTLKDKAQIKESKLNINEEENQTKEDNKSLSSGNVKSLAKEKHKVENVVAEVEVNPIILASRV